MPDSKGKWIYYSWEEFEEDCRELSAWASTQKIDSVYGIPRGGLVVAVFISNFLDIPLILDSYNIRETTLVVDDIVDTGDTIGHLLSLCKKNVLTASLFVLSTTDVAPSFYTRVKEEEEWVKFPWETVESSRYDGTLQNQNGA